MYRFIFWFFFILCTCMKFLWLTMSPGLSLPFVIWTHCDVFVYISFTPFTCTGAKKLSKFGVFCHVHVDSLFYISYQKDILSWSNVAKAFWCLEIFFFMYVYILIYTHTHLGVNYVDEMKFGF